MGHKKISVKIIGEKGEVEKELLIDTGSTYTWINGNDLERIGVRRIRKLKFKTMNGKVIERDVGEALVEINGKRGHIIVVFAKEGDSEVLGVHALESLMLEYNPATRELKEIEFALAL